MPDLTTRVTVMHLALDPAPPLRQVVQVTDLLRSAAVSNLGRWDRDSMLAGKTASGDCYRGRAHRHAHWLPVAAGDRLAGVCLWVPGGLGEAEAGAVAAVRHLGSGRVRGGPLPFMRVTHLPEAGGVPAVLAGPSREWVSLTPYSPARRARPSARTGEYLACQAGDEMEWRDLPQPVSVTGLGPARGFETLRPSRPERVVPPLRLAVTFAEPVAGPLAIGRLSHFGLGVMVPG